MPRKGRKAAPGMWDQNAGTTAPLYFSMMNCFTSGECSAAASFFMSSESLLSGRATRSQRGFIRAPFNNQKLVAQLPGLVKRD